MVESKHNRFFELGILAILSAVFFYFIELLGESVLSPGDGIKHFQIAKYSWQHPYLLFDHWGKPLFTLLSSPFAQFGFKGILVFNVIVFIVTGSLLLKISEKLNLKYGWTTIFLCFATPIYFMVVVSGLTEILFAGIAVAVLYLLLKRNFFWGTILLSFSLFSRPESSILIVWYLLYLIYERKYKYIPLIGVPIILYSVLGYFYHDDIFWVFTKRPYSSTGTYGSGDLFHFLTSYKNTFGKVITISFLVGALIIMANFLKKKFVNVGEDIKWMLLILFPVISIVGIHSILWWKGLQGSAGLLRVLATIAPFVALVCLLTINKLADKSLSFFKIIKKVHISILLFLGSAVLVYHTSSNLFVDQRMIASEKVLLKAAEWYKTNGEDAKVYYMPPYFAYQAKLDPFGEKGNMETMKRFKDKETPSNNMKEGEFLLWEGQFSELEGGLPLQYLLNDKNLVHLKEFYPLEEVLFYGKNYEVHVFKKRAIKN